MAERVREKQFNKIVFERHRVIVDFAARYDVAEEGAGVGELLGGKIRRALVCAHLEVSHHIVGTELTAVMPSHALTQMHDPELVILGIVGIARGYGMSPAVIATVSV